MQKLPEYPGKSNPAPACRQTLERAWLFGFYDGAFGGLPAAASLNYFEHPREDIKSAYWAGWNAASRRGNKRTTDIAEFAAQQVERRFLLHAPCVSDLPSSHARDVGLE